MSDRRMGKLQTMIHPHALVRVKAMAQGRGGSERPGIDETVRIVAVYEPARRGAP